ncbi:hypothetical protein TSOC_001517 [Tetrabaena socialis]|uniref:Uncharacterized protein n=1 Tax=Tetrabaena socialis TaxID=47790 RepID=A0A2J8AGL4_9CHLO|nr:hypothetical protein TSOC_001517 [Tetrabaena socialis]|eukprot:PNH11659.1 hypothetical protein TSOC_001517 [Tetrabaena socialis]
MSDLWDYGDAGGDDVTIWDGPSQGDAVPEDDASSDDEGGGRRAKRKGSRKGKAGAPAKRGRKGGKEPEQLQEPEQQQQPEVFVLSDEEDDLLVLPTPAGNHQRGGTAGGVADAPGPPPTTAPTALKNLDPKTQHSLAVEHELLQVLQEVTRPFDSGLSPLHLRTRRPLRPLAAHKAAGPNKPPADASGSGCAAAAASGCDAGAAGPSGRADAASRASAGANPHDPPAAEAAAAGPADGDRVLLKLAWAAGRDGHVMLRVLRSDPISKLLEKFREVPRIRQLCGDARKLRFLFDGDDLSKTPDATPADLDLEDDMMIDVKLEGEVELANVELTDRAGEASGARPYGSAGEDPWNVRAAAGTSGGMSYDGVSAHSGTPRVNAYGGAESYEEAADPARLLFAGGIASQPYKGGGGGRGSPVSRLADRLAAKWKIILLAWVALAVVGILVAVPVSLAAGSVHRSPPPPAPPSPPSPTPPSPPPAPPSPAPPSPDPPSPGPPSPGPPSPAPPSPAPPPPAMLRDLCSYNSSSLPADPRVAPVRYDLRLSLPDGAFTAANVSTNGVAAAPATPATFTASASAHLNVTTDTACLVLNAAGLSFSGLQVTLAGGGSAAGAGGSGGGAGRRRRLVEGVAICVCGSGSGCAAASCEGVVRPAGSGAVVLDLAPLVLPAGAAVQLDFSYSGIVRQASEGAGLFASDPWVADTPAGSPLPAGVLLTTQLEGPGARQLLPSLDDPSFKAVFAVSVELPTGLTALSNMPGTSQPAATPGRTLFTFLAAREQVGPGGGVEGAGFGVNLTAAAAAAATPESADAVLAVRLAAVQDAQSIVHDAVMLAFSPFTAAPTPPLLPAGAVPGAAAAGNAAPMPVVLAAIDAALTSPLSYTGAGLYSLAQFAMLALENLQGSFCVHARARM